VGVHALEHSVCFRRKKIVVSIIFYYDCVASVSVASPLEIVDYFIVCCLWMNVVVHHYCCCAIYATYGALNSAFVRCRLGETRVSAREGGYDALCAVVFVACAFALCFKAGFSRLSEKP